MHFLSLQQFDKQNIEHIISKAIHIKKNPSQYESRLKNKNIGLLFEKPSTRTKVAFEVGIKQMGANVINLTHKSMQIKRGEDWEDTIHILSLYLDAIVIRNTNHQLQEQAASLGKIPVINALSDKFHPSQIIADLMTILETFGTFQKSIGFLGDGNSNIAHSLIIAACILEVPLYIACPGDFSPDANILKTMSNSAKYVTISDNAKDIAPHCDILYTDVWVSLSDDDSTNSNIEKRNQILQKYQLNQDIVSQSKSNCKIMHCLPAHKGLEITHDVFYSKNSLIFTQAQNKLYAQKSVLEFIF